MAPPRKLPAMVQLVPHHRCATSSILAHCILRLSPFLPCTAGFMAIASGPLQSWQTLEPIMVSEGAFRRSKDPLADLCLPRRSCHGKRAWSSYRPSSTIGDPKRLPMVVLRELPTYLMKLSTTFDSP